MKPYQKEFIEFALQNDVLKFGQFKLKSGRISPYFFNAGLFKTGEAYQKLGIFYATAIKEHYDQHFDVLFGPAYKGIALVTCSCIGLKEKYDMNIPVSFNRKEIKDHGEGGIIIGESLAEKRVLLIDDVITAGATIKESMDIIAKQGGTLIGVMIALDRQEIGMHSKLSAIQEIQENYHIRVASIITRDNLIDYLGNVDQKEEMSLEKHLQNFYTYREQYGA